MTEANSKSDRIHIHKFKLHNVEIQSPRIELDEDTWIERDSTLATTVHPPHIGVFLALDAIQNPSWGLIRWFKDLLASDIVIAARYREEESNTNPFELHDASHIAIALSILSDNWFVAGFEYNIVEPGDSQLQNQPSAPWNTMFSGLPQGKAVVSDDDVETLKTIYQFVYGALRLSTQDKRKLRLLHLFLGSVIKSSGTQINALKQGFPTPFGGQTVPLIFGTMFFENVFTKDGWESNIKDGINKSWNISFPTAKVVWADEVKPIMLFRHILVHDDAHEARADLKEWQRNKKVSDDKLLNVLEQKLVITVKKIMRTIVLNYDLYLDYRKKL